MSSEESELLNGSEQRTAQPRLSCQISISTETDGLRITIAPEG